MSRFGTPEVRTERVGRWASPLFAAAVLLIFLIALPIFSPASGATLKEKLAQKQAELNVAYAEYEDFQDQLNVLAEKHNAAEVRLAEIDDAINGVENEIAVAQKDMDIVRAQLAVRLVDLYKDSYSAAPMYLEVLFEESDFASIIERFSVLGRLADQDQKLFDEVSTYLDDSHEREAALDEKMREQEAQVAELETLQAEMNEKFSAASEEYERLTSQVLKLREEVRKAEEAAAAAAAAKAAAAAAAANTTSGSSGGSKVQPGAFVFPVAGPHSFIDSWGAPRSGGRTHKGTDVMAACGTPVVACVSGTISRINWTDSGLGGKTIWLNGNNGSSYYYAHLDGIADGMSAGKSVSAGQVIGYVGSTGNAGTCNHLHFEIHPGGGAAVNPYATLKAAD